MIFHTPSPTIRTPSTPRFPTTPSTPRFPSTPLGKPSVGSGFSTTPLSKSSPGFPTTPISKPGTPFGSSQRVVIMQQQQTPRPPSINIPSVVTGTPPQSPNIVKVRLKSRAAPARSPNIYIQCKAKIKTSCEIK